MSASDQLLKIPRLRKRLLNTAQANGVTVLDGRHIYILPNRAGLLFAAILLVMLIGAVNYNNSLAFVLTFLLGSLAMVSILHTYRNLNGLHIHPGHAEPVFAGQTAHFPVLIREPGLRPRYSIALRQSDQEQGVTDVDRTDRTELTLKLKTRQRGWLQPGRLRLYSEYPLGLFHAWSWITLEKPLLVYPKPVHDHPLPTQQTGTQGEGISRGEGQDDFIGLRPYQPGDSLRRVAWKAVAREQGLMTKQFSGQAQQNLWLDWMALPALDKEMRLSRLCAWVLDAEDAGLRYGLRLPNEEIAPDSGSIHQTNCLRLLALYDVPNHRKAIPGSWWQYLKRRLIPVRRPTS